jgi:hypothetical protein
MISRQVCDDLRSSRCPEKGHGSSTGISLRGESHGREVCWCILAGRMHYHVHHGYYSLHVPEGANQQGSDALCPCAYPRREANMIQVRLTAYLVDGSVSDIIETRAVIVKTAILNALESMALKGSIDWKKMDIEVERNK